MELSTDADQSLDPSEFLGEWYHEEVIAVCGTAE